MKYIPYLAFSILISCHLQRKDTRLEYKELKSIQYNKFIGMPVNSLLDNISEKYTCNQPITFEMGTLSGFGFYYSDSLSVAVFSNSFHHVKKFDRNSSWSVDSFRIEVIKDIVVYKGENKLLFSSLKDDEGIIRKMILASKYICENKK